MTVDEVIEQVVQATIEAIASGSLSTYTPVEDIAGILGLDAFHSVDQVIPPTQS